MAQIFLSLGSNLGDRKSVLLKALEELKKEDYSIVKVSSIYETQPWGNKDQPAFLNMVVHCSSVSPQNPAHSPYTLLKDCHLIEDRLGRLRVKKWGARTIDIDILFCDDIVLNETDLIIPHSCLHQRRFVLVPLAEIAPNFVHPVFLKTVAELLKECRDDSIVRKISYE